MNTIFSLNFFNFKVVSVMTRSWLFNISTRQPGIFRHLRHLHTSCSHRDIIIMHNTCIRHLRPHEMNLCTMMLTVTLTISALSARCFTCDVSASAPGRGSQLLGTIAQPGQPGDLGLLSHRKIFSTSSDLHFSPTFYTFLKYFGKCGGVSAKIREL